LGNLGLAYISDIPQKPNHSLLPLHSNYPLPKEDTGNKKKKKSAKERGKE
jgi:hypothetical protein